MTQPNSACHVRRSSFDGISRVGLLKSTLFGLALSGVWAWSTAAGVAGTVGLPLDLSPLLDISAVHAAELSAPIAETSAWVPGSVVSDAEFSAKPITQWFAAQPIPDEVFVRMRGKSFAADCTVPREELRYLTVLHYGADGQIYRGEMVVNKAAAKDVTEVLQALFQDRYPIERMRLIDDYDANDEASMTANNSSAFCFRVVKGSKKLSAHARGLAVDINPLYNPYVRVKDGKTIVQPEAGRPYADRDGLYPFRIDTDDLAVTLFKAKGWTWGGDWTSLKDYQHFEKEKP